MLRIEEDSVMERMREVFENTQYATDVHIEIDEHTGEVPTIRYDITERVPIRRVNNGSN